MYLLKEASGSLGISDINFNDKAGILCWLKRTLSVYWKLVERLAQIPDCLLPS
jgi:hypothetical protein